MVRPGLYRHLKGGLYEVLMLARWEPDATACVVYRCTQTHAVWVRPLEVFMRRFTRVPPA
jgi:hypothetical protein